MTTRLLRLFPLFAFLTICYTAAAQNRPIGRWRAHLPYNSGLGVATDGVVLYTIAPKGFFTYNPTTGEQATYSKVEGMHETGTAVIAYDAATGTCIIGYQNSNIDLFRNGNFKVLPDLKNKSFSGSKSINHIYAAGGMAYLSTGLGIVVVDLDKQQVRETYVFSKAGQTIGINAFTADTGFYYAATNRGLYRISRNNPNPQVFAAWQAVDTLRAYRQIAAVGNTLYTTAADTLFRNNGGTLQPVYAADTTMITHIDGGRQTLYISTFKPKTGAGYIYHLSPAGAVTDTDRLGYPEGVVETADTIRWVADLYQGLGRRDAASHNLSFIVPPGPNDPDNTGLYVRGGDLWIAHGGIYGSFNPRGTSAGLSHFKDEAWRTYNPYNYALFQDSVADFLEVLKDERDGTLYAGTYKSGLLALKADGSARIIKQGELEPASGAGNTNYGATGLAIDQGGNLWVNQSSSANELAVRTTDGTWYHYHVPNFGRLYGNLNAGMIVDDLNQKWYYVPIGGGVIVYNDGNTPENGADDQVQNLTIGKGVGNLPSSSVRCLAKDRDGAIWIGTDNGIGIVSCPAGAIDRSCEAEQRIVQYDQFAGYLFAGESVRAIAVDGANRKWVGTTNGVWLLSADANKIVNRFTVDNSPLPSNSIQKIAIDGITGDVYIGTEEGLVAYRGMATDGGTTNAATIQTFPNPVPAGYSGPIAIRGLVTDADVRITDVAGQLIYRTKATGGQVVWNGLDYTGTRPQSGAYLIFITNKDGSQTSVGKMVLLH